MQHSRYQQIERGLNSITRKVLAFVPISEPWDSSRIAADIHRQTQAKIDRRVLDGCLSTLVDSGLVRERVRGQFVRVPVNDPKPENTEPTKSPEQAKETPMAPLKTADQSTLTKVGTLTARLRSIAIDLTKLADEFDDVALEGSKQSEQLDALRKILKGVID